MAAAKAGKPQGYYYEYGNSSFNDKENSDTCANFRSDNNSYHYAGNDDDREYEAE